MLNPVEQARSRYEAICLRIDSPFIFHTLPQHDGSAHIEYINGSYNYVVTERGSEFERHATFALEELLYWLTSDAVFELACKYELNNRTPGQDFRRIMFAKNIELMSIANPEWGERKVKEYQAVLAESPYVDRAEV